MEIKINRRDGKYLYWILCVLATAVASLPLGCDHIMDRGIVAEWVARVEDIASGHLRIFPSTELLTCVGIWDNGMNSQLWFLLSGLCYRLSGDMVLTYRLYMLLVQTGTMFCSVLFFQRFFSGREGGLPACFGVILYMTCPYRIYICYEQANLSLAMAWMLMPLYAWAVTGLLRKGCVWKDMAVAAVALAGIGYADMITFWAMWGIALIVAVWFRRPAPLTAMVNGFMLFLPGVYRMMRYLFADDPEVSGFPIQTIMQDGYRFGQFFSCFMYRDGHPGMGLGMMISIFAGVWMYFVYDSGKHFEKAYGGRAQRCFVGLAVLLMLFANRNFPWDIMQRLGSWSLKAVSLIGSPTVFGGIAMACLCVPAAGSMNRISSCENREIAYVVPIIVLLACLGVCVYQCNMLIGTGQILNLVR